MAKNIEKRIEKLENHEEGEDAKGNKEFIAFLLELRGFKEKDDLGPDPTLEEVLAALRRDRETRRRRTPE